MTAQKYRSLKMSRRAQRGMTLVETLVALAILAGVVLSAYAMLAQAARFTATEQERLIAGVIADNQTIELLVRPAPPDPGEEEKTVLASDRQWRTKTVVTDAGEGLLQISVSVSRAGDAQILARVETIRPSS